MLSVAARTVEAEGVVGLVLRRPDGADLPSWEPGAHIDVILGDVERQYSLCGDPADRASWRIAVLREPAGRGGSEYVHAEVRSGTTLTVRGPRNHFQLAPADRYLFIAGGIGITPILPMLAAATIAGADWTLHYGGRTRASMAFAADLTSRFGDRIHIRPQDESGLLDVPAILRHPDPKTLVYCCGPAPLLAAVEEHCEKNGWPDPPRMERFEPRTDIDTTDDQSFEVVLARSNRALTVHADATILDTVRAAGIEVLYSCTEGTCGTCETDVLEGTPDHRDSVLNPAERAAGDTMMICVSRAATRRLVLDL
ncbi:MAG: oxidoreductase [Catenulispora sp.]|nr:oxidoreductase [Catenulispora sp.]